MLQTCSNCHNDYPMEQYIVDQYTLRSNCSKCVSKLKAASKAASSSHLNADGGVSQNGFVVPQ